MNRLKFLLLLNVLFFIFAIGIPATFVSGQVHANEAVSGFKHFITRSGDKLMDGTDEFRFISVNIPNLHIIEDPVWHLPDPYEQEDALVSVRQMGGQVARIYVISVNGGVRNPPGSSCHVKAPGVFDEEVFRCLDKALELANRHHVRLIIPLVDQWDWFGGITQYCRFRNKFGFWRDPQLIADFKQTISYVLNRTNYYTGIKYKDDKAIMAWETGNELKCPYSWTKEIAAYIKSIDSNHLLIDGSYSLNPNAITDKNIDIISEHYYDGLFAERCRAARMITKGKKPLIIGEFGLVETPVIKELLNTVIENGTSGALIWSLRFHNKDGGFYFHSEGKYSAYHWPGFPEGNISDEKNVLNLLRSYAFKIRKLAVPPVDPPGAPVLLPIHASGSLSWRGSTGASSYIIERASNADGPWKVISANISDARATTPLFIDKSATAGQTYYYRIKAQNSVGISPPSNIMKSPADE